MAKHRSRKIPVLTREQSTVKGFNKSFISDIELKKSQQKFEWSLEIVEVSGKWGFTKDVFKNDWCPKNGLLKALLDRERMTWAQIANQTGGRRSGTNSHHIPISTISREAQELLKRNSLEDMDEIYSLRVQAKKRLFGIIQEYVFYILWYDRNHEICPLNQ